MAEAPSRTALVIFIVVTLIAAGALAGVAYYFSLPPKSHAVPLVQFGGNATVNYIGYFGSGGDNGRVFDTSIYSVAVNNASYPKAASFSYRGSVAAYQPLGVYVGPTTPEGGYTIGNLTFTTVVTGFWEGIIGLPGNSTHTIVIPPDLGYGPQNASCFRTMPLTYTVPIVATYSSSAFSVAYPGISPSTGVSFQAPSYGWNATILAANSSFVTVENTPYVGYVSSPAGWPVVVTSVTSTPSGAGAITLVNQLTAAQAGRVMGTNFNSTGLCSSNTFIVSAVNPLAGTYTENYNREVTGQVLIFVVTVIDIFPPNAA